MNRLLLLCFVVSSAGTLFAGSLPYSASGSTYTGASVSYQYGVYDYTGSSTAYFSGVTSGSSYATVPFSIQVALPAASNYLLNSASLTFTGNNYAGGAYSYYTSSGSQGSYQTSSYGCGFFGGYPCYSNYFVPADASFYGNASSYLTGISDGSTSVSVYSSGGSFNLTSLGFGNDLISGGTLTLTGVRNLYSSVASLSTGFNSYANFAVSSDGSGTESATLDLDGTVAPEPTYLAMLLLGCSGLFVARRRKLQKEPRR